MTEAKTARQYICLKCMAFWFVNELSYRDYWPIEGEKVTLSICPTCFGQVQYVGTHKDRGSRSLFGERIAHLEFIEESE